MYDYWNKYWIVRFGVSLQCGAVGRMEEMVGGSYKAP